jgi:hypothetical protein
VNINILDIIVNENIPNDVVIMISPLTHEEIKKCKSFEEIFEYLTQKKQLVVLRLGMKTLADIRDPN